MNAKMISEGILRALGIVLGVAVALYLLFQLKILLIYIAVASVISLVGRPIVLLLVDKLKFRQSLAAITSMLIIIASFVGLFSLFIPLLIQQGENLSLLNIAELKQSLESSYIQLLEHLNIQTTSLSIETGKMELIKGIDLDLIPQLINGLLAFLGSFSAGLFATLFISFFFLKDSKMLEKSILMFVPNSKKEKTQQAFNKIKNLLSRYFIGLLIQILILFIIYSITLSIFGVSNALIIAFLCALLNVIPYIGPILGAVLMASLTMTSFLGADFGGVILPKTLYVLIGFGLGQLVDNLFTQPVIFSNSVKSHPLEIFLIILTGGLLYGAFGMVLAIPIYTVIKVVLKVFFRENSLVKSLTKDL